jgi:hypothetical protein
MSVNLKIFDLDQVVRAMRAHYPSNRTDHRSVAIKYYNLVRYSVLKNIFLANEEQIKFNILPINYFDIRLNLGKYGDRTGQKFWFDWFMEKYPLIKVLKKGHHIRGKGGELTIVEFTRELEIMILDDENKEVFEIIYQELTETNHDLVPIDLDSLSAYMRHNRDTVTYKNPDANYLRSLDRNYILAKLIHGVAEYTGGYLPQIISQSAFGRKYYKGINLQSAPKIIRHAALGRCYQYDIEASVFTWKFDLAKQIDPSIKLPSTIDYLDFKNYHRKRLSQAVFGNDTSIDTIKRAITAVGFGARASNNTYYYENGERKETSLKSIIKSDSRLQALISDPWFAEFIKEQDLVNKIIFAEYKDTPFVARHREELLNASGNVSKNKLISLLYQTTEATIIGALEKRLKASGNEIVLLCHDGFYTKKSADIVDLRYELQQYLPSGRLDQDCHNKFVYQPELSEIELEHKRFVQEEERRAALTFNKPVHKPQKLIIPRFNRVDDYDTGYDDGNRAYGNPYEYDLEIVSFLESKGINSESRF